MLSRKFQETRVGRIPTGYAAYEAEAEEHSVFSASSVEAVGSVAVLAVAETVSEPELNSVENQA
jgi:hypothetical protein